MSEENATGTDTATVVRRGRTAAVLPKAAARYEKAQKQYAKTAAKVEAQQSLNDQLMRDKQELDEAREAFQQAIASVEA